MARPQERGVRRLDDGPSKILPNPGGAAFPLPKAPFNPYWLQRTHPRGMPEKNLPWSLRLLEDSLRLERMEVLGARWARPGKQRVGRQRYSEASWEHAGGHVPAQGGQAGPAGPAGLGGWDVWSGRSCAQLSRAVTRKMKEGKWHPRTCYAPPRPGCEVKLTPRQAPNEDSHTVAAVSGLPCL